MERMTVTKRRRRNGSRSFALPRCAQETSGIVRSAGASITLTVPGMGSDHCAGIVKDSRRRVHGIGEISTKISNHKVHVTPGSGNAADSATLRSAVERAAYEVATVTSDDESTEEESADDEEIYLASTWRRFVVAAVPTVAIMVLIVFHMFARPVPGYPAIVAVLGYPAVFLSGGWATHVSAWRSLTNRTPNMDVLISMGSIPPYLIGLMGFIDPMTSFIEMAARKWR